MHNAKLDFRHLGEPRAFHCTDEFNYARVKNNSPNYI